MRKSFVLPIIFLLPFCLNFFSPACLSKAQKQTAPVNSPFDNFQTDEEIEKLNESISKLFDVGKYEEAIPLARKAINLVQKEYGEKHNKYAKALNNLAWLLQACGDYVQARQLYEQALRIQENALGPDSPELAALINNLANLLAYLGDFRAALPLLQRVVELAEKTPGDSSDLAKALNNLAVALNATGRHDEALALMERSLSLSKKDESSEAEWATQMNNLALLYRLRGEHEKAISMLQEVLDLREKKLGTQHPDLAESLNNLAMAIASQDKFNDANALLQKALQIQKSTIGASHPDLAATLNNLARLELQNKQQDQAKKHFLEAAGIIRQHVDNVLPSMSFAEQRLFLTTHIPEEISLLLSTCRDSNSLNDAYDHLLRWKGLLIETLRRHSALNKITQRSDLKEMLDELLRIRTEISVWFHQAGSMPYEKWKLRGEELSKQKESLERELAKKSQSSDIKDVLSNKSLKEILATLRSDESLVDIYKFSDLTDELKSHYAAVISDATGNLSFVDIGPTAAVDETIDDWRKIVVKRQEGAAEKWSKLEAILWNPINQKLRKAGSSIKAKAFLVPDSKLARIPWELFWGLESKEGIEIAQLDSPRELVFLRQTNPGPAPDKPFLLVTGGIDFGPQAKYLPASLVEAKDIVLLAEQERLKVKLLTGKEPTQATILAMLPSADYVHLATHGYFCTEQALSEQARQAQPLSAISESKSSRAGSEGRNPLVESGLILAAVEKDGQQVGTVLTAEELVGADLQNCRNITLSACETGLGEGETGQGVLGLRAAIMAAGARSILMSLWAVPDYSTMKLMRKYYDNLWSKKMSPAAALRSAQQAVYNEADDRFKKPVHWAAWVLVGESW